MAYPSKPPANYGARRGGRNQSKLPTSLDRRSITTEAEKDAELLEAIRIGREQLGEDHPLVKNAIQSLRRKEQRRKAGSGDNLTAEVSTAVHSREHELSSLLSTLLGEQPVHEAHLEGFGNRRVDMLFLRHRLVAEENSIRHRQLESVRRRDAELRELCHRSSLGLLEVDYREPLTEEHLRDRLGAIGIQV